VPLGTGEIFLWEELSESRVVSLRALNEQVRRHTMT